ncbi:spore germination protein [Paenibacillus lemnae]|uniref:Spore germination protein n=1 Tax=Paenibacillus lemnae TaxID=1330551 RepID=A0A848MB01_PAELE|nr:spore germination protein [Paenibacillus lemnae]NMO97845.1 spore germination protein [Paenibacillus lemnae]
MFDTNKQNVSFLQQALQHSDDLLVREITRDGNAGVLVYIESLTDASQLEKHVLDPLSQSNPTELSTLFTTIQAKESIDLQQGIKSLLNGYTLYFEDGIRRFYLLETPSHYERSITEPENESIIRGTHNGFIESLSVNLHLIRKQVNSPELTVRYYELGKTTTRKAAVIYMHNQAEEEVVRKVISRIQRITLDHIMFTGFVQEMIEDNPYSLFPQHLMTERPDHTNAYLMNGHVAIMLDGDPTALILPVSFFAFYKTPDDYNNRWMVASFTRLTRMLSFILAFQLPAIYIATVSFHSSILPLKLFFTVQGSLTRVPFPPLIEALLLELIFELLREAGLRLPSRVGQTIGIVGGLVIGDAIVKAGLVSYPMIIVVALTAISSFLIPSYEMGSAVRLLRFPLMIAASLFGFLGISFGLAILFMHLCKLESYGKPYFEPLAPLTLKGWKDTFVRFPVWTLRQKTKRSNTRRE